MPRLLPLGTILVASAALAWALVNGFGPLSVLAGPAILAATVGFVLLLLAAREWEGNARTMGLAGSGLGVVFHVVYALLFVANTPLSIKGSPGTGVNQDPADALGRVSEAIGAWIGDVTAIAVVLALMALWGMREKAVGAAGVALILVIHLLSLAEVTGSSDTTRALMVAAYALGFLAVAVAAALPLLDREHAAPAWQSGA